MTSYIIQEYLFYSVNSYNEGIRDVKSNYNMNSIENIFVNKLTKKYWYKCKPMYDTSNFIGLYKHCCFHGYLDVLKFLIKKRYYFHIELFFAAIQNDNVDIIKFYSYKITKNNIKRCIPHCVLFQSLKTLQLFNEVCPFDREIVNLILQQKHRYVPVLNWIEHIFKNSIQNLPEIMFKRQCKPILVLSVLKWYRTHCVEISLDSLRKLCKTACGTGDLRILQWLSLDDIRFDDNECMINCCQSGNLETLKWLVNHYNLNSQDARTSGFPYEHNYIFIETLSYHHYYVAEYLMDKFALGDIDIYNVIDVMLEYDVDLEWVVNNLNLEFDDELFYLFCKRNKFERARWYMQKFKKETFYYNLIYYSYKSMNALTSTDHTQDINALH